MIRELLKSYKRSHDLMMRECYKLFGAPRRSGVDVNRDVTAELQAAAVGMGRYDSMLQTQAIELGVKHDYLARKLGRSVRLGDFGELERRDVAATLDAMLAAARK